MVRHFAPLNVVGSAGSQLLDVFRREMEDLAGRLHEVDGSEETGEVASFVPRTNVTESDSSYELTLDLPGMKSEDFNIEFHEGRLSVTGERAADEVVEGTKRHRVERQFGKFRRVFNLGHDVDADKVSAEYTAGILRVVVEKTAQIQPKKIEVK